MEIEGEITCSMKKGGFKIDLIVWKLYWQVKSKSNYCWFKIDLIVWKCLKK